MSIIESPAPSALDQRSIVVLLRTTVDPTLESFTSTNERFQKSWRHGAAEVRFFFSFSSHDEMNHAVDSILGVFLERAHTMKEIKTLIVHLISFLWFSLLLHMDIFQLSGSTSCY